MGVKTTVQKRPSRWWFIPLMVMLVILAIIVAFLATLLKTSATNQLSDADMHDIKNVVSTAFNASSVLTVFPHPNPDITQKVSSSDVAAARAHARSVFQTIYAPNYKDGQTIASTVDNTILQEANGDVRILDAGIRDVDWRDVHLVNSDTVSVTIAATAWSKLVYIEAHNGKMDFSPVEGRVEIYTLVKTNGQWLITNMVVDNTATSKLPINHVKAKG